MSRPPAARPHSQTDDAVPTTAKPWKFDHIYQIGSAIIAAPATRIERVLERRFRPHFSVSACCSSVADELADCIPSHTAIHTGSQLELVLTDGAGVAGAGAAGRGAGAGVLTRGALGATRGTLGVVTRGVEM